MPYLGYDHNVIHGHLDEPDVDAFSVSAGTLDDQSEAYEMAFEPAFAYNAHYVGGWWEDDGSGTFRPRFFNASTAT